MVVERTWTPLSAAVLAGGKSSRMGTDKALLPLVPGGAAMLAIVLDRLAGIADELLIVATDRPEYDRFGVRVVPDRVGGGGALAGIHGAISSARHEHCLVVACDMPFLSRELLARMAVEPRDYDVLAPRIPGESKQRGSGLIYQTLHAIYGKGAIPAIEAQLAGGNRQVVGFFPSVRVRVLDLEEIIRCDPIMESFFNANTPESLVSAGRRRGERELAQRLARSQSESNRGSDENH